jgi:hypothetical protein
VPNPFDGCLVSVPQFCFFGGDPEICLPLNLSGLIDSEVTFSAGIQVFYGIGSGVTNRWEIVIVPTLPFDLQIVDVAATVGDLFKNLLDGAIDTILSGAPDWAKDLLEAIVGSVADLITTVLGIPNDIVGWLMDMLTSLGVFNGLLSGLNGYLTNIIPPFEIDDPAQVLGQNGVLIPVMVPIEYIGVQINANEMVIEGDVGN